MADTMSRKECDMLRNEAEKRVMALEIQSAKIDERLTTICKKVDSIESNLRNLSYAVVGAIIIEIILRLVGFKA
jgi:hypothetical protein